jgi:hypothetical protein
MVGLIQVLPKRLLSMGLMQICAADWQISSAQADTLVKRSVLAWRFIGVFLRGSVTRMIVEITIRVEYVPATVESQADLLSALRRQVEWAVGEGLLTPTDSPVEVESYWSIVEEK